MTDPTATPEFWRKCSSCKKPIGFKQLYWVCNVSTCNRKRTGLVFCTVACWDAHNPMMNHRDSWAEERRSPTAAEWAAEQSGESKESAPAAAKPRAQTPAAPAPVTPAAPATTTVFRRQADGTQVARTIAAPAAPAAPPASAAPAEAIAGEEILIVVSKLKAYIRERSGMNTSDAVMKLLSDRIRGLCAQAIRHAAQDGRKTVLDRDF
jgi:hypothetical protein